MPARFHLCLTIAALALLPLPAPVRADDGVLQCTHGDDGQHATFRAYDAGRASLSGRIGGTSFNCPVAIEDRRICGPGCHIPPNFRLYGRLDPADCNVSGPQRDAWNPDWLTREPTVHVSATAQHLYWMSSGRSPCTVFRIEPGFARAHGVENGIAEQVPVDLAVYAGLYPHDPVAGVRLLDHPLFRAAWEDMPHDAELRGHLLDGSSPWQPVRREGQLLILEGCQAHACIAHDWTLRVDARGGHMDACRHDARSTPVATHHYRSGTPPRQDAAGCGPE
ncbi:hypothetical protein LDO26_16730 [Luteimonas sp. BDR2-5]|uniref:hypothetical protein n=1 Tax=Proluteimonas luteida TaxID=2878685 RepID=UPI001E5A4C8E|nr:hypothetical protein [Luteimonas sp. BDR2-5]MCD9029838.1 hypothetical protein [Luteimonas sp. BDR2-5]